MQEELTDQLIQELIEQKEQRSLQILRELDKFHKIGKEGVMEKLKALSLTEKQLESFSKLLDMAPKI